VFLQTVWTGALAAAGRACRSGFSVFGARLSDVGERAGNGVTQTTNVLATVGLDRPLGASSSRTLTALPSHVGAAIPEHDVRSPDSSASEPLTAAPGERPGDHGRA